MLGAAAAAAAATTTTNVMVADKRGVEPHEGVDANFMGLVNVHEGLQYVEDVAFPL